MEQNKNESNTDSTPSIPSTTTTSTNELKRYNYTLEPSFFLIVFAWSLTAPVFTNQLMYQTCTSVYNYNDSVCSLLGTKNESNFTKELESETQPYVANILLVQQFIFIFIGAIMCLRLGPWSDLHGRKPVLIVVYIGTLIQYLIITTILCFSSWFKIDPWWYLIGAFPLAIAGGGTTLTTVAFSYISDITEPDKRAFRNGITQGIILISVLFGSISAGYVNDMTNATFVFLLASICAGLALIHLMIFLRETVTDNRPEERYRDFVHPALYQETLHTAVKPRENYDRLVLWLVLAAVGLAQFCAEGTQTVFFLFVRKKFEWTIENYTAYLSANMIFGAIGAIVALIGFKKFCKMSDTTLTILGYLSALSQNLIVALANNAWHMYVSVVAGGIKNISYVTCRSILTNMGPNADIGKINALITTTESIFQLAGAPTFTQLYKATLNTYPGALNLLSVLLYFIDALLIIIVYAIQAIIVSAPTYRSILE